MSWPELQVEYLGAALAANWLALAWFAWGRAQSLHAQTLRRDPGWNLVAVAALLGALQLISWLALSEGRLTSWPDWAHRLFASFTMARGLTAALAALTWFHGPAVRTTRWVVLGCGAIVASIFDSGATLVAFAGWWAAGMALTFRPPPNLARAVGCLIGILFLLTGMSELVKPDLTTLAVRLPSEQPLTWDSQVLATLGANALLALAAGLALWTGESQRLRRYAIGYFLLAAGLVAISGRHARQRNAARDDLWTRIEQVAKVADLHGLLAKLKFTAEDAGHPDYAKLVSALGREPMTDLPGHLSVWAVRDGTAVHVADAASLGGEAKALRIPPGYPLSQFPNLTLQAAAHKKHFVSGSFFNAGKLYMGMNVPVFSSAGTNLVWLQVAVPLKDWEAELADPRVPTAIALLYASGIAALALAGRVWLMGLRRLHRQTVESETAARTKNEMAGLVSHELRTPLQVVLGHLEILKPTALSLETKRVLSIIEDQCRHLLALVNDTLDLCTLEARTIPLRRDCFDPGALAAAALDDLRPLAAARGLVLSLKIDPLLPRHVQTDERRLRQVLTNLLANAVKFTAAGSVRLEAGIEAGGKKRLVFEVSDTGPGLPVEVLERLGEPFLHPAGGDGTGLGLSLVQRLCRHLEGELTAKNAVRGGCVVTVKVVAPPVMPVVKAPLPSYSSLPDGSLLAGMRIVVAEDNPLVRELLSSYLGQLGADVETVADGEAALTACRTLRRDAIVLDVAMPGMLGSAVAWKLREDPSPTTRPSLVVGLSAQTMEAREANATGFDHFLVKPVVLSDLAALLVGARRVSISSPGPNLPHERLHRLFCNEAPDQLAALQCAVAKGDHQEVARLSHYLQSSAYALSDEPLRAACAALRTWAESRESPEAAAVPLQQIEINLERLLRETR